MRCPAFRSRRSTWRVARHPGSGAAAACAVPRRPSPPSSRSPPRPWSPGPAVAGRLRRALRPAAYRRPPLAGPRHLERRLPAPGPHARRGHGLPVLPGRRAALDPRRAGRRPLPRHQPTSSSAPRTGSSRCARTRSASGSRCRRPPPRTRYSATGTPATGARVSARRDRAPPTRQVDFRGTTSSIWSPTRTRPASTPTPRRSSTSTSRCAPTARTSARSSPSSSSHPPDRNVLAHETGHVFDLPDLYHRPTDGKGDWDTYVGDWDVMGSQFGLAPDLFGWHKWKLGWLDARGRWTACSAPAAAAHPGAAGGRARPRRRGRPGPGSRWSGPGAAARSAIEARGADRQRRGRPARRAC